MCGRRGAAKLIRKMLQQLSSLQQRSKICHFSTRVESLRFLTAARALFNSSTGRNKTPDLGTVDSTAPSLTAMTPWVTKKAENNTKCFSVRLSQVSKIINKRFYLYTKNRKLSRARNRHHTAGRPKWVPLLLLAPSTLECLVSAFIPVSEPCEVRPPWLISHLSSPEGRRTGPLDHCLINATSSMKNWSPEAAVSANQNISRASFTAEEKLRVVNETVCCDQLVPRLIVWPDSP